MANGLLPLNNNHWRPAPSTSAVARIDNPYFRLRKSLPFVAGRTMATPSRLANLSACFVFGVGCQVTLRFPIIHRTTAQKAAELSRMLAIGATARTRAASIQRWREDICEAWERLCHAPMNIELHQSKPTMYSHHAIGKESLGTRYTCPDTI